MILRYCYLSHNNSELLLRDQIKTNYPQTLIYDYSLLIDVRQSGDILIPLDRNISHLPCFIIDNNLETIEISRLNQPTTLLQVQNAISAASLIENLLQQALDNVDNTQPNARPILMQELKETKSENGIILTSADGQKWRLTADDKGILNTTKVVN